LRLKFIKKLNFRYYLKGPKKGDLEIFINLPGSPDNIRITEHGTLLVPLVMARSSDITRTTLLDLFGEYPLVRKIMSTVCCDIKICF
jgi:hypothetical protein